MLFQLTKKVLTEHLTTQSTSLTMCGIQDLLLLGKESFLQARRVGMEDEDNSIHEGEY